MADRSKSYQALLDAYRETAHVRGIDEYRRLYRASVEDPETFFADQARQYLDWVKEWDVTLEYDFDDAETRWFGGGVLNASFNCLDRHLETSGDKIAYYWEGDEPGEEKTVTYGELYLLVNKFAAVLKSKGVSKGDCVVIYMPGIIEFPVAMLACARIGAIHTAIFGGFSAKSLANRINNCGAKLVVTADGLRRAGRAIPLKANIDTALENCPKVTDVIVADRGVVEIRLRPDRDIRWDDAMSDPDLPSYVPPEPMDAEDPLFILYTSGATGIPKGLLHTHAGYMLHVAMGTRLIFDTRDDDVFWCTADIAWISGHSFVVYGPLLNGLTGVLFEGVPFYPDFDRFWKIIEKYRVTKFYTAPAVLRMLAAQGNGHIEKCDLSSLRILGIAGDVLEQNMWDWFFLKVGKGRCPIMDTYWQIETGGPIFSSLPGVAPIKPGSCSFPFFGIDPVILDDTGEETVYPEQEGVLCIRKPWPGMARTIYGDHERYMDHYFSKIPDLFFTADGAKRDEDGYYRITGRIDDVINVLGHRLGSTEIESALALHKDVDEAAVVGYPHPIKGQGIYAFVTLKHGAEKSDKTKMELRELIRTEIGPIAGLDIIQWADGLPRTRSGKILRHILDKIAAGTIDELGDTSAIADASVIENLVSERLNLKLE